LKEFLKTLFKFSIDRKGLSDIDNVLLDIRCRELSEYSKAELRKMTFLSLPFSWILEIIFFPMKMLSVQFLFSLLVALVPYLVFSLLNFWEFLILVFIVWAAVSIKSLCSTLLELLVDLTDLILLGRITSVLVSTHSALPNDRKRRLITKLNQNFIQHMYTSRPGGWRKINNSWEGYFVDLAKNFLSNKTLLREEVDDYWSSINDQSCIYKVQLAPTLNATHGWEEKNWWKNVTKAKLVATIDSLDDINCRQGFNPEYTLLGAAVELGAKSSHIEFIISRGGDVNHPQVAFWKNTFLYMLSFGVCRGDLEVVNVLLDAGADVDLAYENRETTILQDAAFYPDKSDIFILLFDKYPRFRSGDSEGNTLLHYLASSNHNRVDAMRRLTNLGFSLEETNHKDRSVLLASIGCIPISIFGYDVSPNLENFRFVLEQGPDPSFYSRAPETNPASWLLLNLYSLSWSEKLKLLEELERFGLNDYSGIDYDGDTFLHGSAKQGLYEPCDFLLTRGLDPHKVNERTGRSAFQELCLFEYGDLNLWLRKVDLYLEHGCDINSIVKQEKTALDLIMEALSKNEEDIDSIPDAISIKELIVARQSRLG
jgi:ankyrin repeat protein